MNKKLSEEELQAFMEKTQLIHVYLLDNLRKYMEESRKGAPGEFSHEDGQRAVNSYFFMRLAELTALLAELNAEMDKIRSQWN